MITGSGISFNSLQKDCNPCLLIQLSGQPPISAAQNGIVIRRPQPIDHAGKIVACTCAPVIGLMSCIT